MSLASNFAKSMEDSARKTAVRLSSSMNTIIFAVSTPELSDVSTFVTQTFKSLEMDVRAIARRQAVF